MHLVSAESLILKSYEIHYWQRLFQTQKRADILYDVNVLQPLGTFNL